MLTVFRAVVSWGVSLGVPVPPFHREIVVACAESWVFDLRVKCPTTARNPRVRAVTWVLNYRVECPTIAKNVPYSRRVVGSNLRVDSLHVSARSPRCLNWTLNVWRLISRLLSATPTELNSTIPSPSARHLEYDPGRPSPNFSATPALYDLEEAAFLSTLSPLSVPYQSFNTHI